MREHTENPTVSGSGSAGNAAAPAAVSSPSASSSPPVRAEKSGGWRSRWFPSRLLRRFRPVRRFGEWFVRLPAVSDRVPPRFRPTLYLETVYNIGTGALVCLFLLSAVVLKTIIDGTETHLAVLGAFFGGSSLFSPVVSYLGRKVPMKTLVVLPNVVVAILLLATVFSGGGATFFTLVVGLAFIVRVFPRVAEMNMYRVNYPPTHRSAAVGWTKAVSAVSALAVTVLGYWWFCYQPQWYWLLYWLVSFTLLASTVGYAGIPVPRRNIFEKDDATPPHRAFWEGVRIFLSDRRFLLYQLGFSLAGFANHMAMVFVAEVLRNDVIGRRPLSEVLPSFWDNLLIQQGGLDRATAVTVIVGLVFAVLPTFLMMASAAFWGRFLDRINPMLARALFNTFQCIAYALHAYGGLTLQLWPMVLGATLHAIGNGGSTINWLTGSLYFASEDRVSLYNAVHVGLTGLRGMIAPVVGWYLLSQQGVGLGAGLFWLASGLSLLGVLVMGLQGMFDPGPREKMA